MLVTRTMPKDDDLWPAWCRGFHEAVEHLLVDDGNLLPPSFRELRPNQ